LPRLDGAEGSHILIVAGAQEGIDLLSRCLIEPGDRVIIDRPTFPGAIQALAGGRRPAGGMGHGRMVHADALERLLIAYRPKLIFTMPTYHNPTARTMDEEQRARIACSWPRATRSPLSRTTSTPGLGLSGIGRRLSLYRMDRHNAVIYLSARRAPCLRPGIRSPRPGS
jgi:hypothetical protein